MKKTNLVFLILCVLQLSSCNQNNLPGIITNYCAYFTEPNFDSVVTNEYEFKPLESITIYSNGKIINDSFILTVNPITNKLIYLNKDHVYFDVKIKDKNKLRLIAKEKMYIKQLELWNISTHGEYLKNEDDINKILEKNPFIGCSFLSQDPNYSQYISKKRVDSSSYYFDIEYIFSDKKITVHHFNDQDILGSIVISSGTYTDGINIGIKRNVFNSILGIPNSYSTIFSSIDWNDTIVKYKTNEYVVSFYFSRVGEPQSNSENVIFDDFTLSQIEIENPNNDSYLP